MESYQLRKITIIGISVLCLSPIEFFSNKLLENKKEDTAQIVMSTEEIKLKPNYLSSNYEIFNPEIKTTSEEIEKLVNENKEKEIIEYENKLELERAKKAEEEKRRIEEEKRKEEERKEEERKRAARVYRETTSSTNQEVQNYTNDAQVNTAGEATYVVPQPNTEVATNVVNYALQFVGNPYVANGTDLYNGIDCSGFTMKIYEHFGYSLPHRSTVQATYGTSVSFDQIAPGDLIFYGYNGRVSHVALYIGNGQIVHAATSQLGIVTGSYKLSMPIITIKRILN